VGHAGDGGAPGATDELEPDPAVARRGPSGPERDVLPRLSIDVRDAVGVVDELKARPARQLLVGRLDRREVLGKEELVDVSWRDVVAERREAGVERKLIRGVDGERYAPVTGRQDVAGKVRGRPGRGKTRERQSQVSFQSAFSFCEPSGGFESSEMTAVPERPVHASPPAQ